MPHFEKAIEIDPNFALAYVKMAVATGNMGRSTIATAMPSARWRSSIT